MALLLTPRSARRTAVRVPPALHRDGGAITIGRDAASDLALDHPLASARHCTVSGAGNAWQIHDSSSNGTFVNGERVSGARTLRNGDVIGIADMEFAVTLDGAAPQADPWGRGAPAVRAAPPSVEPTPPPSRSGPDPVARAAIDALARLTQARLKARREIGAPATDDAANPLASGSADAILARLAAMPPAAAAQAVTQAGEALAAHDRALLAAMQATFHAALDHFAPAAIRQRAATDAAAWKAYERAFAASDGFVETFAQELAKAYRERAG